MEIIKKVIKNARKKYVKDFLDRALAESKYDFDRYMRGEIDEEQTKMYLERIKEAIAITRESYSDCFNPAVDDHCTNVIDYMLIQLN